MRFVRFEIHFEAPLHHGTDVRQNFVWLVDISHFTTSLIDLFKVYFIRKRDAAAKIVSEAVLENSFESYHL